ncbi:MAG: hypothetical protein EOO30_06785 [Comamonadaceae bacterium]|nr:MAG: hypothetical protein EOO30_06785 [Comamonadaceae bacterium]
MIIVRLRRKAALFALCCIAWAPGANAQAWRLRPPAEGPVVYRGVVNFDAAGAPHGSMLYPGGAGAGGLLVAIIAHGMIVESTKAAQKQKMQEEADRILLPFQEQLATFRSAELLQLALQRLQPGSDRLPLPPHATAGEWTLAAQPVFGLTQDRQALILDNAIAIFPPGETEKPAYSVVVRVVSSPRESQDPVAAWSAPAESGTVLKEESAQLVAHSLALALRDSVRPVAEGGFRTLRYRQGTAEKMERAQPLEVLCRRVVVRNLRGWLMSLPQTPDGGSEPANCEATAWR